MQDNDAVWVNDFNTDIIPHTDVVAIGAEVSKQLTRRFAFEISAILQSAFPNRLTASLCIV